MSIPQQGEHVVSKAKPSEYMRLKRQAREEFMAKRQPAAEHALPIHAPVFLSGSEMFIHLRDCEICRSRLP